MFVENTKYEILTPTGWCDFSGIKKTANKLLYSVEFDDGTNITATFDHKFFQNNVAVKLSALNVGDLIDTKNGQLSLKISNIIEDRVDAVYTPVAVDNNFSSYFANSLIINKNCDEFAFVQANLAQDFWTAIQPTLATGGGCILTSTPNGDDDIFAQTWRGAIDNIGSDGLPIPGGVGKNGFKAFFSDWTAHPERDFLWADTYRRQLGEDRFKREMECCAYNTSLNLLTVDNKEISMSIGDLYNLLNRNK